MFISEIGDKFTEFAFWNIWNLKILKFQNNEQG